MGKLRSDNSVKSSNTPAKKDLAKYKNFDYNFYRAMVVRVYYTDDPKNLTQSAQNPQVTYDVIITSGVLEGQIINNVRPGNSEVGGQYNFDETTWRAASKPFAGPDRVPFNQQDGDVVYIQFTRGSKAAPIVVGAGQHPLDSGFPGATSTQGPRKFAVYNGIETLIDNQGQLTLTRRGGQLQPSGYFKPLTTLEAELKLLNNGISRKVKTDQIIEVMDGNTQKMTITFKGGMVVTLDGANDSMTVQTAGGASLTVDGKGDTVKAVDKEGGTLKISGGKVGLGASSAEVVDLISQLAQGLVDALGNLGYPLSNQATFATIKGKADGIKGGI